MKLYIYAAIALAFAGLLARDHIVTKQRNAANARASVAEATLAAQIENTRKADEAAKRHETRADALEADRRDNPLPAVRVCRKPASVPQSGTAAVAHEAAEANDAGAHESDRDGADIGPALDDFATDAEANLIQCEELQRWLRLR